MHGSGDKLTVTVSSWIRGPISWKSRRPSKRCTGWSVTEVNTANYMGKAKSRYTRAGLLSGRANNFKKAFVTLKDGDKIDFYSNI